ncbi:hypothetical protein [Azospirillum sp. TSA6c]|uniref:hypothetical protein n=1 Tax=Azospirillum sp. TSA6c TaxID=709813 RepID=UPI0018EE735C|nr:hypothetical protein [Azospirillum sp. TSA6c]
MDDRLKSNQTIKRNSNMPRGGARPGAGRKVGAVQKVAREAREKAAASGMLPHEFLLAIMRDEVAGETPTFEQRLDAAKAAAPYYAPKLAAVSNEHSGPDGKPIQTDGSLRVEFVAAQAPPGD